MLRSAELRSGMTHVYFARERDGAVGNHASRAHRTDYSLICKLADYIISGQSVGCDDFQNTCRL